jgi:hypothetical protein
MQVRYQLRHSPELVSPSHPAGRAWLVYADLRQGPNQNLRAFHHADDPADGPAENQGTY